MPTISKHRPDLFKFFPATIAITLSLLFFLLLYIADRHFFTPPIPLTRELPAVFKERNAIFDKRVQDKFPLGSSEKIMDDSLAINGFQREDWATELKGERSARRIEQAFPCQYDYVVYWKTDPLGRLTSVRGSATDGCL